MLVWLRLEIHYLISKNSQVFTLITTNQWYAIWARAESTIPWFFATKLFGSKEMSHSHTWVLKLKIDHTGQVVDGGNWNYSRNTLISAIKPLRYAHHSLLGKILLIKTMLASRFVYKFSLLATPPLEELKKLDAFYYDFLWGGKGHQICKKTMELDIRQGGFRMLNVYWQELSLKFIWISRLLEPEEPCYFWQAHIRDCFKLPVKVVLSCNITHRKFTMFIKDGCTLPEFWMLLLKSWFRIRYIPGNDRENYGTVLQTPICFNSAVSTWNHFEAMHRRYQHMKELGLLTVEQFLRRRLLHSTDKDVSWFVFHIPRHWLGLVLDDIDQPETLITGILDNKWPVKAIYNHLMDSSATTPPCSGQME